MANLEFIQTKSLIKAQLYLLKELVSDCLKVDKYTPEMHWHLLEANSSFAGTFLISINNKLIGFLRVFFFYQDDVEIILLINPKYRRQGLATKLLNTAKPLLKAQKIQNYRFSINSNNLPWLEKSQARYDYTDYFLEHNLNNLKPAKHKIETAKTENFKELIKLDKECFSEATLTFERLKKLSNNHNSQLLIINLKADLIAKLHLQFHKNSAEIFDVAVSKKHQRQGYASSLLRYALQSAAKKNKIKVILNTESENDNALTLYLNNGFIITDTKYYWQLPIDL